MLSVEVCFGEGLPREFKERLLGKLAAIASEAFRHNDTPAEDVHVYQLHGASLNCDVLVTVSTDNNAERLFGIDSDGTRVGYDVPEKWWQIEQGVSALLPKGTKLQVDIPPIIVGTLPVTV